MSFIQGFCLIGTATSLFLGFQFLLYRKQVVHINRYLGVFFILIAIRLGKLLIQQWAPQELQTIYFNIMHASYLALGPISWFYIRDYTVLSLPKRKDLFHFFPALLLLLSAFSLRQSLGERNWLIIYWFIQMQPLYYVWLSQRALINYFKNDSVSRPQLHWLSGVGTTVLLVMVLNISYFVFDFPFYVVTSSLLVLTIYLMVSLAFNDKLSLVLTPKAKRYQHIKIPKQEVEQIWADIKRLVIGEELFLEEQLKVIDVSEKLQKPSHVISMVVNSCGGKSFIDFINELRIKKAESKIATEADKKIIAVALECGFSSLSAFNRAFKKNTGLNPSTYRKKLLAKST
ncbi:MAG: helix-turn-helix domain-containing protein [Bacteroidota bacterium]